MKESSFIKKPVVTVIVVIIIAITIFYLKSQKAGVSTGTLNNQLLSKDNNVLNKQPNRDTSQIAKEKASKYPKAPDFVGIERWINSEPLTMEQLKGKVVLVDIWTYTCINCIRTLPYLKEWYKKYEDKGFVIVGVHSPEFEFEKKYENVLNAVNEYQLKYPVALDNNHATWDAYQNRYWPHKFLVDIDGYIRFDHIGEGGYEDTEKIIQSLLNERMERLNKKSGINSTIIKSLETTEFQKIATPEIYFGYQFSRGNFGNEEGIKPEAIVDYKIPDKIRPNFVYVSGKWKNNADNMELADNEGEILLAFQAKNVNIVAGSENDSDASVFLDNTPLNEKTKGTDVIIEGNSSISRIKEYKLYNLASAEDYDTHIININVEGKGFKIYTFTFG